MFDNDTTGIKASEKIQLDFVSKGYKAYIITLPPSIDGKKKIKDFDDIVVNFGLKAAKKILKRFINNIKNGI